MYILTILILLLSAPSFAATLTVGNVPKVNTGGSTPKLEDSTISVSGSNVGINTTTTIDSKLKIIGGGGQLELVDKSWEKAGYADFSISGISFSEINSMETFKNKLYLGYDTDSSSNKEEAVIYTWNGNTYSPHSYLGSGADFEGVSFLKEYKGKLYAGQQGNTVTGGIFGGDVWVLDETDTSTPLLFNGLDSNVVVQNSNTANAIFGATALSIEWKGKLLGFGENNAGRLLDKTSSTTATIGYRLYVDSSYHVGFGIGVAGVEKSTLTTTTVTPGIPLHIVATWADGFAPKIYINGTEAAYSSNVVATTPGNDTTNTLTIGNRNGTSDRTQNGFTNRVRIYRNTELTAANVTTLYGNGTVAGSTGEYLFTDASGSTLTDSSGNGNNGTISNCIWNPGGNWNKSYENTTRQFSYSATVFKNNLYVGSGYSSPGEIYSFDGTTWSTVYSLTGSGLITYLYVYNGRIFGATGGTFARIVSSSDGITWNIEAEYPSTTYTEFNSLIEYRGKLYASVIKGSGGSNDILVRDNVTGTWSVLWSAITGSQVWGMNVYNDALYFGSSRATAAPYTSAIIYKSTDGINYSFDFEPNQLTNRFEYEAFKSINYNGSMYWGFGGDASNSGTLWRKTDSLGQRLENIDKISSNFRLSGTNTNAQITNDKSRLSISLPTSFDSGILSGVNWGSINGLITSQNWQSSTPYLNRDAINWPSLNSDVGTSGINWQSVKNSEVQGTGVNWQSVNLFVDGTNLGIGSSNPTRVLDVMTPTINVARFTSTSASGTGNGTANFRIGTNDGAALSSGDKFVTLDFFGSRDASNNVHSSAGITAYAMEDWGASNAGSRMDFETTTLASTTRSSRMSINGANIGIGTSLPDARFQIQTTVAQDLFRINDNGVGDPSPFIVNQDGNVGIGTVTVPSTFIVSSPTAQTIASGNTIASDSCGSVKLITSAGAVTTSTTNTFTATSAIYKGCCMRVINVGANAITLDNNANFFSNGAADVVLGAADTVEVCTDGSFWYQIGATGNN